MKAKMLTAALIGLLLTPVAAFAQAPCLHGSDETPDQAARRKQALQATRTVNNIQANQPGSASRLFLKHEELSTSPFVQNDSKGSLKSMNVTPGQELLPGWQLTLDVTPEGYWFMVKDKTDPCGFAFISNTAGLIYVAHHLR
jgi:hypothetical protein